MKKHIFCPMITKKDIGGGIKSTIALLNGLCKENHFVTVLLPKECDYLSKLDPKIQIVFFQIDPVVSLTRPLTYFNLCKEVKAIFAKLPKKKVYLSSDRPALMLALFIAKTETIFYISRGWFYTNWSARYLRILLFPKVSQFVGISEKQYNLMKQYTQKKDKVKLIKNGITLPSKQFIPFKNKIITITTIGGICNRKNQQQCLELIKNLKQKFEIQLFIFGTTFTPTDQAYKKQLEGYIKENQLEKNVFFKGHETNFDKIYGVSDIVISSATEEGFGRTLIEAMSYGIPVIASDKAGGPSMIIEDKKDGLLYDGSLLDLIEKTIFLIENEIYRKKIIELALLKVKEKYTEAIMAKNYSDLIENGK